ncbi:MAG: phosphotransbutyrylase [Firmicutes bacterium]|nr:phosphotransbutyrylase [Bacillota bacterium]MDI6705964.1 phosphate butyryltransferase [Bacillota bacterium]
MIRTFEEILSKAREKGPKTIAVAVAQDEDVLKAVYAAYKYGIINAVFVGDKEIIESIARENGIDLDGFEIIDVKDKAEACRIAVEQVRKGKASMLMKGFVDTSVVLKAVLDKEAGLMSGSLLSHVGVLKVEGYDRLFILSDAAMNIAPTLEEKVKIIENAVKVAHALGNDNPKVAVLCAVEKVNPKMQATLDADELAKMNERGEIRGCTVGGPFALDNAVSVEAANHKGIKHPVAGHADVLITPDIEAGNLLNKSMEYFGRAEKAGIIMGAGAPIVLTSRASSDESKLNSIALAVLISSK